MELPTGNPERSEQPPKKNNEPVELDNSIVRAIELLLQPLWNDIKDLIKSQSDMKNELSELTGLQAENEALHLKVNKVVKENKDLTARVCELENKLLETSVIIHGLQESQWETEAV